MPIDTTIRCDTYRNLNKPGITFSVRQRGLVVGHTSDLILRACRFKHASDTQQTACRSRRLVCQWISGLPATDAPNDGWVAVLCDPKKINGFRRADTGERIDSASFVSLSSRGCFAII